MTLEPRHGTGCAGGFIPLFQSTTAYRLAILHNNEGCLVDFETILGIERGSDRIGLVRRGQLGPADEMTGDNGENSWRLRAP